MDMLVLMGSPLPAGNTAAQVRLLVEEAVEAGKTVQVLNLNDMSIIGCQDCRSCQSITDASGCAQLDDMQAVYPRLEQADCIILATPIFTWFCTAPVKAVLDRLFCETKYNLPEQDPGHFRLQGKTLALLTSCGDPIPEGTDLLEAALKRLCAYGRLNYAGMLAIQDIHGLPDFTSAGARASIRSFVRQLAGG